MIPVTLHVDGGSYDDLRLDYEVVRHSDLAPLLMGLAAASAVFGNLGYEQELTVTAHGAIRLHGLPQVPLEMVFSSGGRRHPAFALATRIQQVFNALYQNPFREPEVESVEIGLRVTLDRRSYTVESLLYDRGPLRPGDELPVQCVLRSYRGEAIRRSLSVKIPDDVLPGSDLRLAVGDSDYVDRALGRPLGRRLSTADDLESLVRALGARPPANRLTAVLYRAAPGVVAGGSWFAGLPGTAASLIAAAEGRGAKTRARVAPLLTLEHDLDGPLSGGQLAKLRVRPPGS